MSGSHCTPHWGATIRLKHKKTDEAQKAETVLSAVSYIYIDIYIYIYIYIYYHICGKLEVAFKASPSSQHQHCTDEAQKAETVLSAVRYSSLV